jgi:hypothetical protein
MHFNVSLIFTCYIIDILKENLSPTLFKLVICNFITKLINNRWIMLTWKGLVVV